MLTAAGSNSLINTYHWTTRYNARSPPVGVWMTRPSHHLQVITRRSQRCRRGSVTLWGGQPVEEYPQEHPYFMILRWLHLGITPQGSHTTTPTGSQTVDDLSIPNVQLCFANMHSWNCWRLKEDNPQVVELALNYARTRIATFTTSQWIQEELWQYDWHEIMGRAAYACNLTHAEDEEADLFPSATHYHGWETPGDYRITSTYDIDSFPPLEDIPDPRNRVWISADARVLRIPLKGQAVKTKVVHLDGDPLHYQQDNLQVEEKEWLSIRAVSYLHQADRSQHRYRVSCDSKKRKEFSGANDVKREAARLQAYRYARTLDEREGKTDIGLVMAYPYSEAEMASLCPVKQSPVMRKSPSE